MKGFKHNYGVVRAVLDHERRGDNVFLQVEWEEKESITHSWEPLHNIYRDVPDLVEEYYKTQNLSTNELFKGPGHEKQTMNNRDKNLKAKPKTFER